MYQTFMMKKVTVFTRHRREIGERVTKKGIWGQKVVRVRKLENAVSRSSEGVGRAAGCLYGSEMMIGHH